MYTILTYTYLLLPLSFLFFRKKWKSPDAYLIALYGVIAFIFLFIDPSGMTTLQKKLYTFGYTTTEYFFFTLLLFLNISSRRSRLFIIIMSILFFLFQIIYFSASKLSKLDSIAVGIETILLFIYIFIFFYEHFRTTRTSYIYNNHCFWIAVGILIYLGGAFFLNIYANHMTEEEIDKYWDLTYIAEILKNIFFVIAIVLFVPRTRDKSLSEKSTVPYLDMN